MKKIFKIIIAIASVLVVALVVFLIVHHAVKVKNARKQLRIETTANVVSEIKNISEFTSAAFYEEVIIQHEKGKVFKDNVVIIANGKARAGFNLSKITSEDVVVEDSVLTVKLPKAEILDVIVNPSDFDVYIEEGKWSDEEVLQIKNEARDKIRKDAIADGLLKKAKESGVKMLTEMFKAFGFSKVVVEVKE